LTLLVWSSGL